jgi:hypothetical protein
MLGASPWLLLLASKYHFIQRVRAFAVNVTCLASMVHSLSSTDKEAQTMTATFHILQSKNLNTSCIYFKSIRYNNLQTSQIAPVRSPRDCIKLQKKGNSVDIATTPQADGRGMFNSRQWQEFLFFLSSVLGTTQPPIQWTTHLVTAEQNPHQRRPTERNFAGSVIQCLNHPDNGVQANVTLLTFDQFTYTVLLNTTSNYHQIRNSPSPTLSHAHTKKVSERTACVQNRKLPLNLTK